MHVSNARYLGSHTYEEMNDDSRAERVRMMR